MEVFANPAFPVNTSQSQVASFFREVSEIMWDICEVTDRENTENDDKVRPPTRANQSQVQGEVRAVSAQRSGSGAAASKILIPDTSPISGCLILPACD